MFASHRDACILSYYAWRLNTDLEKAYASQGIGDNVIAYRALGRGNYHFASDVYRFASANAPVAILAYDVTKFFDTLDHSLLKARLRALLEVGYAQFLQTQRKLIRRMTLHTPLKVVRGCTFRRGPRDFDEPRRPKE